MSSRQALASALHLFVVLAFFLAGFFFIALPYLPELKTHIFEKSTLIGLILFLSALILLIGFYALDRGRYLVIRMGVSAEVGLVRQAVEECFAKQFPKKLSLLDVETNRKSLLEIRVSMAPLDEADREALFIQAETALSRLLRDRFGYSKSFYFTVKQ